jgi:hypothetical protein
VSGLGNLKDRDPWIGLTGGFWQSGDVTSVTRGVSPGSRDRIAVTLLVDTIGDRGGL